jgi:hypothetical protein
MRAVRFDQTGRSRRAGIALAAALAAASLMGCDAKGVGGSCPDINACGGGSIVGSWTITGDCQAQAPAAQSSKSSLAPVYTTPQTPLYAAPPSTSASGYWCQGLVYRPASVALQLQTLSLYAPPKIFQNGTLVFNADQTYTIVTTAAADDLVHLPPVCLTAFGGTPTCQDIADGVVAMANPNYAGLTCTAASDGGCDCDVNMRGTGSDNGTWQYDSTGTIVYEFSTTARQAPVPVSFCVSGTPGERTLTMGGYNGATIGSDGLRSIQARETAP